jgi:hypothetical protein
MTPKEKAEELVDGFKNIDIEYNDSIEGNCFMTMTKSDAKQCALIAVNEMLTWFKAHSYSTKNYDAFVFYNEVKQEIETL